MPLRGGGGLALDLYRPRGTAALPLVVAVYGGAWRFGARADLAPLARWYAARGYAVAAVDYRHAPRSHFPAQLDDVEDALRALAAHAPAWRSTRPGSRCSGAAPARSSRCWPRSARSR